MHEHTNRHWHHGAKASLFVVAALLVGGILILWSWNTFAGDLFQAPDMKFRHALAAETLIGVVAAIVALSARVFRSHAGHRDEATPS